MKTVFLDTNVVIDLLDKREFFYIDALKIFTKAYNKEIKVFISPITYATASYVLRKHERLELKALLSNLRQLVSISICDDTVIDSSLESDFEDFEDAMQFFCALSSNAEIIVTRNKKDFYKSTIKVMTPSEFLSQPT